MSTVEQEQTATQDAACGFQPEYTGSRKSAGNRKQIPTLIAMKSSKPNLKSPSGKRGEEPDSNSNSSRVFAVPASQQSSPTVNTTKLETNQQISDNTSHGPKHIPDRQLHSVTSTIKQRSKEKRKKSDSNKSQSMQNESLLLRTITDSTKHSFSSNDILVSEMTENKVNNSTVKQAAENESAVKMNLLKATSLAADDSNSCTAPKEAAQKETHGVVSCSGGVLQESQELNISDHAGINKPTTEHKRRHTTPGVGKGNAEPYSSERFPSCVMARRSSRSASVSKEPAPRARRCLSFDSTPGRVRARAERANSIASPESATKKSEGNSSSVDSLRNLNLELRDQVTKMRHQLESQRGNIKQAHWQKVLDLRQLRQQEHERLTLALAEQKEKLDKEKAKEIEHIRDQLTAKGELDLQKLTRHKDAEIAKLKMEVSCKDVMVQRLLGENRHAQLKLNIDVRKSKLLDDLKELRREKKELEDTLSSADTAGRTFSNDLRKRSQNFEQEIAKVKREAQIEIKQLIEQLKNKDKLISQLEKDLGHKWVAAHLAALERECSEGARGTTMSVPSHPLGVLPDDSYDPFSWTPTSTPTTGGVEEERSNTAEGFTLGKPDLPKKLKDCKERNKELVEKCREYLYRNKELIAQNRAYKDSSEKVLQENRKMQELLEHSKLRVMQLSRKLGEAQAEKTSLEQQTASTDELRQQIMEDKKTISALRQACANKDRRIELMQHHKRKRRLVGSAEKSMGVKETFFGYEEDTKSVDSDNSFSSHSHSTISDDDVWDEVLSMEETERNYQRLMMEQLQLQKSYAQLQGKCQHNQDPQREAMAKMTLQNDLFNAQCRVEKLEKLINEVGEGEVINLLKERETIIANSKEYLEKAQFWEQEGRRVQHDLNKALERCEDLEFQLMEMEQERDDKQSSTCEVSTQHSLSEYHEQLERLAEIDHQQHVAVQQMEQLRNDLVSLLKGKGREGDAALKMLDKITEEERRRAQTLESIAGELQMKVITLQKEKDALYDQINFMGQNPGKGNHSAAVSYARERQENLELKNEVAQLSCSESKLLAERVHLLEELEDWKTQYETLKQQLDILTKAQSQQKESPPLKSDSPESLTRSSSSSSLSPTLLTRRPSKDRKSKPRSGDDPMETKRRRSSRDTHIYDDSHSDLINISKNLGDVKSDNSLLSTAKNIKRNDDVQTVKESIDDIEAMKKSLRIKDVQLQNLGEENFNLQDQLRQCALEKSAEAEADQQLLLDKVEVREAEIGLLRKENEALAQRLKQRMEEYQEELNPRVTELEDYCEDLQERLHASEMTERHLRDKLKLVEQSIDESENTEMAVREKYEELLARETEFKKQIQELQRTGRELRDIVLDKDIVEQALRDKVDFLQKAEAASSKRIDELEAIEHELREQLELRADSKDSCHRELHKIQELKHQITFLETDNKALSARVAELEENEEILRENWRRVADEDFNRTQCLEEKVKMLESFNRDLKSKLADAQEYFVINTVPSENSLAAELARSHSRAVRRAATFDDDDYDNDDGDSVDGQDGNDSDSTEASQADADKKNLREKLKLLERQLSDVAEEKNTKIESLQEKIVSLKENEIKLSETIAELEMIERELRAKLALYESSEITVEKMLKYQSKIEELRTSQESLLDQIESMENQGMSLQEHMQEMERTLRGKIVTLEVEMKGFKQKELKDAARIRELEKQEKELSEKVAQQAEKENGLYVKISSLMDEHKKTKEELTAVKSATLEKEDKVRKASLMEVRYMEKEMESGKKISSLSTKLRHKEEELRQKEAAHQREVAALQRELSNKSAEESQKYTELEKLFAQKEKDLRATIAALGEELKVVINERDDCFRQIQELTNRNTDLNDKDGEYSKELDILRYEVASIKISEQEYEEKIRHLQDSLEVEKRKREEADKNVSCLEKELAREKENVLIIEDKIINVKSDIGEKMKNIELSFVEKESEYEKQKLSLEGELRLKNEKVRELEKELSVKLQYISELEAECNELKSKAALRDNETMEKIADFGKMLVEKNESIQELQNCLVDKEASYKEQMHFWETECAALKEEISEKNKMIEELKQRCELKENELSSLAINQATVENDLQKRLEFLNIQLLHETASKEKDQFSLEQAIVREKMLSSEIGALKQEVKQMRQQLLEKCTELENKNKENGKLGLELDNLRQSWKTQQNEIENFKDMSRQFEYKFQVQKTEQDNKTEELRQELDIALNKIQQLELEMSQKDSIIEEVHVDKEIFVKENQAQMELLMQEKQVLFQEHMQKSEYLVQKSERESQNKEAELARLKLELSEKNVLLEKQISERSEMDAHMLSLHSQIQNLRQNVENVSQKLVFKTSEAGGYQQEIQKLKEEREQKSLEIELLKKQIAEQHNEMEKRFYEQKDNHSLISLKQQELDQAKTELQKCLQEIEKYKNTVQFKENEFTEQNQRCRQMSASLEELNVQYRKQNSDYKHLESKVTNAELRLVDAENRYRELEAKCASLEMQLQESFAQTQHAEKVVRMKEEECKQLEVKLTSFSKDYEATSLQIQETEKVIIMKQKEFKHLESELEKVVKERDELKAVLSEKGKVHEETFGKFTSLQVQHEQLKSQSSTLHGQFLTQHAETESEVKALTQKLSNVEEALEEAQNQLKTSEKANIDLKEKLHKAEEAVKLSQESCNMFKEKLCSAEKQLSETNQSSIELSCKISTLENTLRERESLCRDSQSDFGSLKEKYSDVESECRHLRSQLNHSQQMAENSQILCKKHEEKLQEMCLTLEETRTKLTSVENKLSERDASCDSLLSQLENSQRCLDSCQEEAKLYKSQVSSLGESLKQVVEENKDLVLKSERLLQEHTNMEKLYKNHVTELEVAKERANCLQQELIQVVTSNEKVSADLVQCEQKHANTLTELASLRENMESVVLQNEVKCSNLDSLCQTLKEEINSKLHAIEVLKASEAELTLSISRLHQDNASLKAELETISSRVQSDDSNVSELIETNQNISGKLYQMEEKLKESDNKVLFLEQNVIKISSEKDDFASQINMLKDKNRQLKADNAALQEELNNAAVQLKNTRNDFDKSQATFESHLNELAKSKEETEKVLKETQTELIEKSNYVVKMEAEIADLKSVCCEIDYLKSQVSELERDKTDLLQQLTEQGSRSERSDIVNESDIFVSLSAGLHAEPTSQVNYNDSTELRNTFSSYKDHCGENGMNIEKLMCDIDNYKRTDTENQEKLHNLEKLLKEMREKEAKMSERMCELEVREKELLEQISDIETTVIVPLETENQELKDEVNVIKQERDDAQSRISKWGDDEEDHQDIEMIHKCLEDALITRDELEKKIEILSADISRLEQDKENFMKKIVDLETNESEYKDKIESLEDEVERLHGLERTTFLVEETETCLMDRVLDLEEKEQQLLEELAELKSKTLKPAGDQVDGQVSYESLSERLTYLEQKNAVLQDAECRYMDKIVELEEIQQRLQSEILSLRSSSGASTDNASVEATLVSKDTCLQLMQNASTDSSSTLSAKSPKNSVSISTDTADLTLLSEQTINSSDVPSYINQLEIQIKNLTASCTDKTSKLKYLEEKCELLHDSEAKLMEKLLENENSENTKTSSCDNESDLKQKLETLTEENEFLAENVENYKQLYKEEKEKNNDLHDRLLENSSIIQELLDTKDELKDTQKMVEEIQSEYEEQLSEREDLEAKLGNLLAQSQQRINDLQIQLIALQQHEEESQRLNAAVQDGSNPQDIAKIIEHEKTEALQKLEAELKSYYHQHEEELQKQITFLQQQLQDLQADREQLETQHKTQLEDIQQSRFEVQQHITNLQSSESGLQTQVTCLIQREQELLNQVDRLEKQLEEMKDKAEVPCEGPEEESFQSDSGMSADDQRTRYSEKSSSEKSLPLESPVTPHVFSSLLTLNLSQSTRFAPKRTSASYSDTETPSPEPVPPTYRGKARQASIDSISQEELVFLVEELQNKELALKKRLQQLEAFADSDLSQRVEELELENQTLQRKLRYTESQISSSTAATTVQERSNVFFPNNNTLSNVGSLDESLEDTIEANKSSSILSSSSANDMLDRPEDVLHKRIKELENQDKHNKDQLSDLERDREVLHEIARKDKATIHDLSVRIRELELCEHTLKDQVNSLEASESSLFSKCEDLEAIKAKLEDRVHELAVHERRLRELVHRLKLDEEHWLSKSGGMESAVAELSANEQHLKRLLQDVAMEKSGLSERADYLEARVQELETVEASLLQRLKNYENVEVNLKNKMVQLENSERAAYSKVSELDVMNLDLSQRLQKALEENVVLSQHISQLQGQINELDRRLLSSQDSELAYKQHMESLQKNESSLQKRVREYELREIDSQAKVRELEQMNDILGDKLATLQRSENRLRHRLQELESLAGQGTGELTATQKQKVPQKLEDCQKHVINLQNQVESLQLQLREALRPSQTRLASKTDDTKKVSMPVDEYRQLQTKSALLEETMYQMEEVERVNRELSETILQLRQGKGASGHEVEIEVLKRRLASYKTFISKLKSSLSVGQATSLWDPELDSGLQGDTLPARQLHGLESERVLQSVRGLQEGKADTSNQRGAQQLGLTVNTDTIVQSKATLILSAQPADVNADGDSSGGKPKNTRGEESHWRAIEARKPVLVASSWGGAIATVGTGAKQASPTDPNGSKQSSTPEVEEVIVSLHLQSESELSSHHRTNQNDTDSSSSPVPPPRRMRAHRASKSMNNKNNIPNSGNESSDGTLTESDTPANTALATNKKHFGNQKSLPSSAYRYTSQELSQKRAPLTSFGEDSFYLPSSTQEGVDSLDDGEAPPLPSSGPPGAEKRISSPHSTDESGKRKNSLDSLDNSSSGMSIRDRIAMIERQFQVDKLKDKADDDQVLHRKKQASDGMKQANVLEKDNKHLRDEINRLEKELEDKRRYINILELWLSNLEELLKNPNKQTDRQLMEQLHQELIRLRSELKQVGYSREDAVLDPAALKTELERRNREIVSKRNEIDSLTSQLKDCQEECRSVEGMRQTTLDCLRALEHELIDLQDKDQHLLEAKRKIHDLRTQFESKCVDVNNEKTRSCELELTLGNTILERDRVKYDLKKVEEERDQLKPVVEELSRKLEDLSRAEVRKSFLEEQLNSLNSLFISRAEKTKEVYEENLILRDHLQQSEAELLRLRNLCDDFNNLSARFDEMEHQKQQAANMVRPLQTKLEHLARKCQEKDALLHRLGAELRRSTYRPSSALDDLGRLETVMNQEDYNTDFPQVVNRPVPLRPEQYQGHSPTSSVEELEFNYPYSDTDSAPATISKRKRPKPYISNRPRSADTFGSGPGIQRGPHAHSRSVLEVRRLKEHPGFAGLEAAQCHFVAIADYDPVLFSQSGRSGLELGLREGQMVLVTGPMDRTGYFEAEVNGRIGLVPANYLQPVHRMSNYHSDSRLFPSYDQRSEQMTEMFRHLYPEPSTTVKGSQNVHREGKHVQTCDAGRSKSTQNLLPDPPCNLHVRSIINETSILLSWSPPRLDNRGNNSGMKLLGFMVYLDNQEYMRILNPKICETIMENLNLEQPHHLAVQSLYTDGHVSARTELVFEGIVRMVQGKASTQRAAGKEDLDTDLSSVLSNVHYKRGHRKTMMALYDYNPEKQSPHDYTSFELAFPAGQLLYVYGQPRPDGFFHGEIEGKRGLVPACFVEDVSERTQKRIMNDEGEMRHTQH